MSAGTAVGDAVVGAVCVAARLAEDGEPAVALAPPHQASRQREVVEKLSKRGAVAAHRVKRALDEVRGANT